MVAELLLEIGTEEIPAGYLENGLRELRRLAYASLEENRIEMAGGLFTYGTPRRLVLIGKAIAERQEDLVQELTGPPRNVAYDAEGRPTKAAMGFARKQGVSVEDLQCVNTPKGEYLYVKRRIPGKPTAEILAEALPTVIGALSWPKSMRWGDVGFPFVRPIHWVVALFNGEVIPFDLAGVTSGNVTRGHRFMSPEPREIADVADYLRQMADARVMIDPAEREREVERLVREAAAAVGGTPARDPALVGIVANLVEYPSAVCGGFDAAFLELPAPVLITAMREHQKYFAVYDDQGRLMPNFVAVNNTVARDESVVRKGHERVLRARLSDADFFFREDLKRPLSERLEDLKGVIYQAELGTSHAKVLRFAGLAQYLAGEVLPESREDVKTAAMLCKCDLVTQMVGEFPGLQGTMGRVYARAEGYPEEICEAIEAHYLPTRAGGELPASAVGAVVGMADRMDTIVGCFAVGLEPTGSADPFALRRHALAVIRIMEDRKWGLSLEAFVQKAVSILSGELDFDGDRVFTGVIGFFRERYRQMMLRSGYEPDQVEAVISVAFDRIDDLRARIDQLRSFASRSEGFGELALAFKRVTNILKKQTSSYPVDPGLFREPCESALWEAYGALKDDVVACIQKRDYEAALGLMARLRKPVDEFFDGVEILTREDAALRENRVGVLQRLADLFLQVADLSKLGGS